MYSGMQYSEHWLDPMDLPVLIIISPPGIENKFHVGQSRKPWTIFNNSWHIKALLYNSNKVSLAGTTRYFPTSISESLLLDDLIHKSIHQHARAHIHTPKRSYFATNA